MLTLLSEMRRLHLAMAELLVTVKVAEPVEPAGLAELVAELARVSGQIVELASTVFLIWLLQLEVA